MDKQKNYIYLKHSNLLSIPLLGSSIYLLQIILVLLKIKNLSIFFSNENRKLSRFLIKECNQSNCGIVCRTVKIGYILKFLERNVVLDLDHKDRLLVNNDEQYQNLMWTFVFVTGFSFQTKKWISQTYGKRLLSLYS
jgi:hypothetical protein